jgi:hypothetical protein
VPPKKPTTPRHLTLRDRTVGVGVIDVATGDGCAPGAAVTLTVRSHPVATATADAAGHFEATFTVPDLVVGEYAVQASCGHVVDAAFDVVQTTQSDPGTTTMLVLIIFILLGFALLRGQSGSGRPTGRHHA